ncbi:MAG TPA: universal stress protein [Actinocrinis sp.]|nr:universal stress protein [Actinocrinis sp.]
MTENTAAQDTQTAGRIVVGVDFSENAVRAADWAAREAADRGLELHVVHALDLPGAMGELTEPAGYVKAGHVAGENLLGKIVAVIREKDPGLTVTSEVSELDAAQTLVQLSRNAQLIVTGTRGHGGFAGMLLGSVSLKLAAHAHCPAVVVRGEQAGEPLNEIVLGVESDQAEAPIRFAFETAAKLGATLTAVRAWWPQTGYGGYYFVEDLEGREEAEKADMADLLKAVRADYPEVTVTTATVRGNAVPMLIGASQGTRLLVVGSHHHHGPLSVGGYVVQGLLAHSPTPVAVVPIM